MYKEEYDDLLHASCSIRTFSHKAGCGGEWLREIYQSVHLHVRNPAAAYYDIMQDLVAFTDFVFFVTVPA